jgi:hypothetical protein
VYASRLLRETLTAPEAVSALRDGRLRCQVSSARARARHARCTAGARQSPALRRRTRLLTSTRIGRALRKPPGVTSVRANARCRTRAQSHGSTGDRAVIAAPQVVDYIAAIPGASNAGQIAVPLSVRLGDAAGGRLRSVLRASLPALDPDGHFKNLGTDSQRRISKRRKGPTRSKRQFRWQR